MAFVDAKIFLSDFTASVMISAMSKLASLKARYKSARFVFDIDGVVRFYYSI